MRGRNRGLGVALAVVAIVGSAGSVRAEPYHNDAYHFSLDLNRNWQRLTESEIREADQIIRDNRARATPSTLVDGFRRRDARPWNKPPLVIVNFIEMKTTGLSADDLERETVPAMEEGVRMAHHETPNGISKISIGAVNYDRERRRLSVRLRGTYHDGSKFESLTVGHVGAEGIVALCYLTSDSANAKEVAFSDRLNDSFQFDAGHEFVPVERQPPLLDRIIGSSATGPMMKPVLIGGGVAVVIGFIGLMSRPRVQQQARPW